MTVFSKVLPPMNPALELAAVTGLAIGGLYLATYLHFARHHKHRIPSDSNFPIPLVGGLLEMIRRPTEFWDRQAENAKGNFSWLAIAHKFVVFATKAEHCHRIFQANGPDSLTLVLHPNGRIILGEGNIAFMTGPRHKALRASFLHLFTPKALGVYLSIQEQCIRKHLAVWLKEAPHGSTPTEMRDRIRDMNCETSQTVFMGPHLVDTVKFTAQYMNMTKGFLAPPIYFPGTWLYKAVQSRKVVIQMLIEVVQRSKAAMSQPGATPVCLIDFWVQHVQEEVKTAKESGLEVPDYWDDHRMADAMMDFLFAAQDASTASLTNLIATMAENPQILARVREEQDRLRSAEEPLSYERVNQLQFTRQCVLEMLRLVPPAPMVPMQVMADFKLTDDYTAKKGTVLIPSLVGACREGFPEPLKYDPDRMGPERHEDVTFAKQFIPFGIGPHRCVGYNYAIQHLTAFLAVIAAKVEWQRTTGPDSHKLIYLPTLYPHDCLCTWGPRVLN